jgi:hypothetical protein
MVTTAAPLVSGDHELEHLLDGSAELLAWLLSQRAGVASQSLPVGDSVGDEGLDMEMEVLGGSGAVLSGELPESDQHRNPVQH